MDLEFWRPNKKTIFTNYADFANVCSFAKILAITISRDTTLSRTALTPLFHELHISFEKVYGLIADNRVYL